MKGYLVLNGGDAFSPRSRDMDYAWLQLIRQQNRPRLAVVPVASVSKPGKEAPTVARYFKHLGTHSEYTMITDRLTANTATEYGILDHVDVIALIDGSPLDMIERIQGTHTEEALRRAIVERRGCVMATGASAMALGAVFWFAGEWETGLALAPHLAILPHHALIQMRLPPERLFADLPEGVTLLGVDDATSLICHPDGTYQVLGQGTVTVYRSVERQDVYGAGETLALEKES